MAAQSQTRIRWKWFRSVVHHAAIDSHRRCQRWRREMLTLNNETEDGEEWGERFASSWATQDFKDEEMLLFMEQTLPGQQFIILLKQT